MMATLRTVIWVVAVWLSATGISGSPHVNYPIGAQFPPIARVGEAYNFQFAATTFEPDPEKLQYSLVGNPSWLFLNGKNRTLWGTPGAADIGDLTFKITAAGEAGAVATMETKLVVSNSAAPKIHRNISEQLSSAGQLSDPSSVTLLPSEPLDLKFASDTFQASAENLTYYATLADNTPLPAWISFDAATLHFAGTTPPLPSSPQEYGIRLIASDVLGFSAASIYFTLVISNHQLLFKPLQQTISVDKGRKLDIPNLRSNLFLDGSPVGDGDVQSATADIPSWLSFNDHTLGVTGSPPSGQMSQDFNIIVKDKFGDTAKTSIHINFLSQLFKEEIGQLNITAGKYFEYKVPKSILAEPDDAASIEFGSLATWLEFNPTTFTISGTIPEDFASQGVQVKFTAKSRHDGSQDSQTFQINVSGAGTHVYTGGQPTTKRPAQATATDAAPEVHNNSGRTNSKNAAIVAGSVMAALVGSLVILILACLFCRRRRKSYIQESPRSPRKTDISRPILISDEWVDPGRALDTDLEKAEGDDALLERTPERPPQLDLNLLLKSKSSPSAASSIAEGEAKVLTAFDRSSWGFRDGAGPSHHPSDSMRIPTEMARRESATSNNTAKRRHRTTAVYRDPYRRSGLPSGRRLTSVGHGRQVYSECLCKNHNYGFRRPLSIDSSLARSTSPLSVTPSSFPRPPTARHTTQLTTPMEKRQSIRLVSSPCDSLIDRRTIEQKRKSYIKKRASAQSPFFGASGSRVSSASYKSPPFANETGEPPKPSPSPLAARTIVNSNEEMVNEGDRDLPESLRIRKPSQTPSVEAPRTFAGSLRKPPSQRSFTRHMTTNAVHHDHVPDPERPNTIIYSRSPVGRAAELRSSLNRLTASEIYEDAEMSESVYSAEEEEIANYEKKRDTIKPSQFSLPLKLNPLRKSRSKRVSKRISQRDPTPYSLAIEHGGKENRSSTYSLGKSTKAKGKAKATTTSQSHERPHTIATASQRPTRPALHSRTESRTTARSSTERHSQNRPLSRQPSHRAYGSHPRPHSRQSSTKKHSRNKSRTQSSAYPYFDANTATVDKPQHRTSRNVNELPQQATADSLGPRDPSGNVLNYALHEDPDIEELASCSIGLCTSNGPFPSSAQHSRLAQLTSHRPDAHYKRDTAIRPSTPHTPNPYNVGLGLSLIGGSLGRAEETPGAESEMERGRERTPLSMLEAGNGASPGFDRLRVVEGKARRPLSVEVDQGVGSGRGRRTWGSLKAVVARNRCLVEERESKAFL